MSPPEIVRDLLSSDPHPPRAEQGYARVTARSAAGVAQYQRDGDRDDVTIEGRRVRRERGVLDRDRERGLHEQDRAGEAEASERRIVGRSSVPAITIECEALTTTVVIVLQL